MVIILVTVVVEGPRMPAEFKGSFSASGLIVNSGITQAIGVISFGSFV